jgi:hypothetical protein
VLPRRQLVVNVDHAAAARPPVQQLLPVGVVQVPPARGQAAVGASQSRGGSP